MIQAELISLPLSLHRGTGLSSSRLQCSWWQRTPELPPWQRNGTLRCRRKERWLIPFVIAAFLASWFAIAAVAGDGSNFPIAAESRRLVSGLVALGPFVIAVVALFAFKSIRAINAATPSSWLIAVQTYRVAGIMFVFPFLTYGIVPAGFGWPRRELEMP